MVSSTMSTWLLWAGSLGPEHAQQDGGDQAALYDDDESTWADTADKSFGRPENHFPG